MNSNISRNKCCQFWRLCKKILPFLWTIKVRVSRTTKYSCRCWTNMKNLIWINMLMATQRKWFLVLINYQQAKKLQKEMHKTLRIRSKSCAKISKTHFSTFSIGSKVKFSTSKPLLLLSIEKIKFNKISANKRKRRKAPKATWIMSQPEGKHSKPF